MPLGLVDLVDEEDVGNAPLLEVAQDDLQVRGLLGVGLGDDDRHIAGRQCRSALVLEFDGAWTIDEGVGVIEEFRLGDVELDRHLVGAGFRALVADRVSLGDLALALHGVRAREDRLEECCLAALERPDECDQPCPSTGWAIGLPHVFSSAVSN